MEELKQLAKNGPDFDEEPLKKRAQSLAARRLEASSLLEDQNKYAVGLYRHLDSKIQHFGASTLALRVLLRRAFDVDVVSHDVPLVPLTRSDSSNKHLIHLFPDGCGGGSEVSRRWP